MKAQPKRQEVTSHGFDSAFSHPGQLGMSRGGVPILSRSCHRGVGKASQRCGEETPGTDSNRTFSHPCHVGRRRGGVAKG